MKPITPWDLHVSAKLAAGRPNPNATAWQRELAKAIKKEFPYFTGNVDLALLALERAGLYVPKQKPKV